VLLLGLPMGVRAADDTPAQAALRFPLDEGAHPGWKTEWWYVTGWLQDDRGRPLGFQITFFRNRGPADASHTSRFAPHQILLAHAALSDPEVGQVAHQERMARAGFGLAEARSDALDVHIDDWGLRRRPDGRLVAEVRSNTLSLSLELRDTQAPLLQGSQGFSRKGHDPRAFSWYYSLPHLQVSGTVRGAHGAERKVHGRAWMDHEWSNAYVSDNAVGWDWTGLNFSDGSALMAFRMRDRQGRTLWSSGTWRDAAGQAASLGDGVLQFEAGRTWTSSATGARYPLDWTLSWPGHRLQLRPLFDDQEMDTRNSTGTAYWEGAVQAFVDAGSAHGQAPVAQGYLELTGYWKPLQF
jgi:predicted secreted hydrolase